MNTEQRLRNLASNLKPTTNDKNKFGAAFNAAARVLHQNQTISVAEVWRCGSIRKGTAIKGQSDVDMVVLCSPGQNMTGILELMAKAMKGSSTTNPEIKTRAVTITVRGVEMDIVPTKIGITGDLGRAQREKKSIAKILELGDIFRDSARILKQWRYVPENAPQEDHITSFGIEVILAFIFRKKSPEDRLNALSYFYEYVIESELSNPLGLHSGRKTLTTFSFDDIKKKFVIDQSKYAIRLLNRSSPDLSFLGI